MTVRCPRGWLGVVALPGVVALVSCHVERADAGRPGGPVAAATAPADSAATAQVLATLRLFYERLSHRDLRVLSRSFWPHATITSIMRSPADSAAVVATSSIEDLARRGPLAPECRVSLSDEMTHASVTMYGPLAQAWVTYRWRCGLTRDSTVTHNGVDAFELMRFGGEWRISSLAVTRELPDQPLARPATP